MNKHFLKYALVIFLSILAAASIVGGHFYYTLHTYVYEYLSGFPGHEDVLAGMNQILYCQIIVLILFSAGISLIAAYKLIKTESK